MKNQWIVVEIKEGTKFYAHIIRVTENDNLLSKLDIDGIVTANMYTTKKKAESITRKLRAIYKSKDCYMFDETF